MKLKKNRKLKGSVLLTVVSVMALLIIFMASTLTLATAANNRAHANYSDSQAEYTARAAIEGFTQALSDNDAVAQAVVNMDKGKKFYPKIEIADASMGTVGYYDTTDPANPVWKPGFIKVEYIKDNMAYDKEQKVWVPMQVLQITATGKVGKEEKSISYFIERTFSETQSASIKGFQTLGDAGAQNNGGFTGALTMGLDQDGSDVYKTGNDFGFSTDTIFVNGTLDTRQGNKKVIFVKETNEKNPSRSVITGDLILDNSGLNIELDYPIKSVSQVTGTEVYKEMNYSNIPYLFVHGDITGSGKFCVFDKGELDPKNSISLPVGTHASEHAPYNIFCKHMNVSENSLCGADVYLFGLTGESSMGTNTGTHLYNWSTSVVNKTQDRSGTNTRGGSIYCNHNLKFVQDAEVHGDVVVQGDLDGFNVNKVEIWGDLVVKGEIKIPMDKVTVHGNIYNDKLHDAGGTPVTYYRKDNEPADGIDPNFVEAENKEFDESVRVENFVVYNIPVNADIQLLDNEHYENTLPVGYVEATLTCGKNGDWRWVYWTDDTHYVVIETDQNVLNNNSDFEVIWNGQYREAKAYIKYETTIVDGEEVATSNLEKDSSGKVKYVAKVSYIDRDGNETDQTDTYYNLVTGVQTDEEASYYHVGTDEDGNVVPVSVATEAEANASGFYLADKSKADKDGKTTVKASPETIVPDPFYIYQRNYDGEVTDTKTTDYFTYYLTKDIIVDPNLDYFKEVKPVVTDPSNGTYTLEESGNVVNDRYSYWKFNSSTGVYDAATKAEAIDPTQVGKYKAWFSPAMIVDDPAYYYDADPASAPAGSEAAWHAAHEKTANATTKNNDAYPVMNYPGYKNGAVYPTELSYKKATEGSTKFVMSLEEARQNIGLDPDTGTVNEALYDPGFSSASAGFTEYKDTGAGEIKITSDAIITGSIDSTIIKVVPKDASSTIKLVLKGDPELIFKNGAKIVVANKGACYIYLEGATTFNGGDSGIFTEKLYDAYVNNTDMVVDESDKMNIIMYGAKDSSIGINNTGIVCATAKCPFTELKTPATQGLSKTIKYITKAGDTIDKNISPKTNDALKANWIGSGLFKSATTNDDFCLLYTQSVDDSGKNISNANVEGANWQPKYYDAY